MNRSSQNTLLAIQKAVRDVPDFPQPGIIFRDITPVLARPELFHGTVQLFVERYQKHAPAKIVAIDARGFILGSALAYALNSGLVLVRKAGKLPAQTIQENYALEYGVNTLEIHADGINAGEKVIIVDDVLATGGTARAALNLVKKVGAQVLEIAFLIELSALNGRQQLVGQKIFSLLQY